MDDRTPRHAVALEQHLAARECVRGQIVKNQVEPNARGKAVCRSAAQKYRRKAAVCQTAQIDFGFPLGEPVRRYWIGCGLFIDPFLSGSAIHAARGREDKSSNATGF